MVHLTPRSAQTLEPATSFPSLSDYGVIGNCHTAALVSREGSIDWLCLPRFDSPSLFARVLDLQQGGFWSIQPSTAFEANHRYLGETNVLETTFTCDEGKVMLLDLMDLLRLSSLSRSIHLVD